jgi:hypothetical protein
VRDAKRTQWHKESEGVEMNESSPKSKLGSTPVASASGDANGVSDVAADNASRNFRATGGRM